MAARKPMTVALVLAGLAALAWLRRPAADLVLATAGWVEGLGWIAPLAFSALFAVAIPLLVPAAPFLLAAGVLFGPVLGTLYACLGNLLGGMVSFAAGRYLLREAVEDKLGSHPGFEIMSEALRREGLRGAVLIRFSPVLPAWLINYGLGVSPLGWRQYLLSAVAIVPTAGLYSLSGAGLGDLAALERGESAPHGPAYYALLGAGFVATIAATALLGRRARSLMEDTDGD